MTQSSLHSRIYSQPAITTTLSPAIHLDLSSPALSYNNMIEMATQVQLMS